MTAVYASDFTVTICRNSDDINIRVDSEEGRTIMQIAQFAIVGSTVTLRKSDGLRFLTQAERLGLIVAGDNPCPVRITAHNGDPVEFDSAATMFDVDQWGTIRQHMFDHTNGPQGTRVAEWTTPGHHTAVSVRIPQRPTQGAKRAICWLMDRLLEPVQ
jgi:hypothetical protein